jgi:type I restriction enzyme, S subunit
MEFKAEKLPDTWERSTLGAIAKGFLSGGTPSTKNDAFWQGTVPWITSKWLNSRLCLDGGEKFISDEAVRQSATAVVPRDNLIFATRVGVGKVAINRLDLAINQDLAGVLVDPEKYDLAFLAYQLRSGRIQNVVTSQKRGATIQGITRDSLKELEIYLPPRAEQQKIAAILSTVQRAIEQQERLLQLTTELKKSLLQKLFTEGLHGEPQKMTEIGPVPESWKLVPLSSLATIERGKFAHRPRNHPRFYGGSTPFVQTGDVSNCDGRIRSYTQSLNKDGVEISKIFPAGTILITIAANIGFTGILDFDSACPDSLIGLTPTHQISVEFLQYYLSTQQPQMDRMAPQGAQKNINIQFLKPWPILLPSKEEQAEIVKVLAAVDTKLAEVVKKRNTVKSLFRTLLHQLMTAQIRVNDLDLNGLETLITKD